MRRREATRLLGQGCSSKYFTAARPSPSRFTRTVVSRSGSSFGSQSDGDARTRRILMAILHALSLCTSNLGGASKRPLDKLAAKPQTNPHDLLLPSQAP